MAAAATLAVLVLVQGAGVAESAPNPGGPRSSHDRDFVAQGAANVASGLVGGQPIGGSVGQTALAVSLGARTRLAAVSSGAWMLLILATLGPVVSQASMPTLAAILVVAGLASLRPHDVGVVVRTGRRAQVAMVVTLVATLLLPVAAAIGLGIVISLLLQIGQSSADLRVSGIEATAGGRLRLVPLPDELVDGQVVGVDIAGSLLFAGARRLADLLPDPTGRQNVTVVLRLRGRPTLGATAFQVLAEYAGRVEAGNGHLVLTGIEQSLAEQWSRRDSPALGRVVLYPAEPVVGSGTARAITDSTAIGIAPA